MNQIGVIWTIFACRIARTFFADIFAKGLIKAFLAQFICQFLWLTIWNVNRKALWFHITLKTMTGGEFWNYQLFHLTDPGYRLSNLENSRIILKNGVEPTMTFWTFDPVGIFSALLYFAVTEQLGKAHLKNLAVPLTKQADHSRDQNYFLYRSYCLFWVGLIESRGTF